MKKIVKSLTVMSLFLGGCTSQKFKLNYNDNHTKIVSYQGEITDLSSFSLGFDKNYQYHLIYYQLKEKDQQRVSYDFKTGAELTEQNSPIYTVSLFSVLLEYPELVQEKYTSNDILLILEFAKKNNILKDKMSLIQKNRKKEKVKGMS